MDETQRKNWMSNFKNSKHLTWDLNGLYPIFLNFKLLKSKLWKFSVTFKI
jgi:hypothetical protein